MREVKIQKKVQMLTVSMRANLENYLKEGDHKCRQLYAIGMNCLFISLCHQICCFGETTDQNVGTSYKRETSSLNINP